MSDKNAGELFTNLLNIMERLRGEGGCPWDREQTRQSLKPFLVEEVYEVLEAIEGSEVSKIREELGDLLFQIIFHVQLAEEQKEFTMGELLKKLSDKMISRHPHVFENLDLRTSAEVLANWEEIKKREENNKDRESILDGIPRSLPALLRAQRIQGRASRVGFDWEEPLYAFEKISEEMGEFRKAIESRDKKKMEEELGDILFALVNVARLIKIDSEDALHKSIRKFMNRFNYIEKKFAEEGKTLKGASLKEMDILWDEAKKNNIC